MTITTNLSAETLDGNGSTTSFPFSFRVFTAAQLQVWLTDSDGVVAQTTDFSAVLTDSGGTVTYPVVGTTKLPSGSTITIMRNMEFTQPVDLVNATTFHAEVIEDALDGLTMQVQQVKEAVDRAVTIPLSSSVSPTDYLTTIEGYSTSAAASAATATTQAGTATTEAGEASASAAAAAASAAALPNAASIGAGKVPLSDGTTWTGTSVGAGDMLKADNLSGLADAATARTNLGLGTAAVLNSEDITPTNYLQYAGLL